MTFIIKVTHAERESRVGIYEGEDDAYPHLIRVEHSNLRNPDRPIEISFGASSDKRPALAGATAEALQIAVEIARRLESGEDLFFSTSSEREEAAQLVDLLEIIDDHELPSAAAWVRDRIERDERATRVFQGAEVELTYQQIIDREA